MKVWERAEREARRKIQRERERRRRRSSEGNASSDRNLCFLEAVNWRAKKASQHSTRRPEGVETVGNRSKKKEKKNMQPTGEREGTKNMQPTGEREGRVCGGTKATPERKRDATQEKKEIFQLE